LQSWKAGQGDEEYEEDAQIVDPALTMHIHRNTIIIGADFLK